MHRRCLSLAAIAWLAAFAGAGAQEPNSPYAQEAPVGPPVLYGGYYWGTSNDIDGGGALGVDELVARLPLFILGKDKDFFVTGSLKYQYHEFEFDDFGLLPDLGVHSIRTRLTGYWEPANSPWFAQVRLEPGLYSDGTEISSDDYQSRALAGVGYRLSPNLRLMVGAWVTESYGSVSVFPLPGVIWTPNDTFGLHLAPPDPRISYYPTHDWALHVKFTVGGGSWNIDRETSETVDQLIFRSFRVGLGVERRIYKQLWAGLWAGTDIYQNLEFQDSRERVIFESDVDPGLHVYLGFHLAAW